MKKFIAALLFLLMLALAALAKAGEVGGTAPRSGLPLPGKAPLELAWQHR